MVRNPLQIPAPPFVGLGQTKETIELTPPAVFEYVISNSCSSQPADGIWGSAVCVMGAAEVQTVPSRLTIPPQVTFNFAADPCSFPSLVPPRSVSNPLSSLALTEDADPALLNIWTNTKL